MSIFPLLRGLLTCSERSQLFKLGQGPLPPFQPAASLPGWDLLVSKHPGKELERLRHLVAIRKLRGSFSSWATTHPSHYVVCPWRDLSVHLRVRERGTPRQARGPGAPRPATGFPARASCSHGGVWRRHSDLYRCLGLRFFKILNRFFAEG